MPRRFDRKTGWNRQFKWKPLRRDRWDPFPKDHLPFIDDFSVGSYGFKRAQVQAVGEKRTRNDMLTPTSLLGRVDFDTARQGPPSKRQRSGNGAQRSLFTNDNVAMAGTAGAGLAGMAYSGIGAAVDAKVKAAVEQGFAQHAVATDSGVFTYDTLTESAMTGSYLDRIAEIGETMLPYIEDLLVPLMV